MSERGRTRLTPGRNHGHHLMRLAFPLGQHCAAKAVKGRLAGAPDSGARAQGVASREALVTLVYLRLEERGSQSRHPSTQLTHGQG